MSKNKNRNSRKQVLGGLSEKLDDLFGNSSNSPKQPPPQEKPRRETNTQGKRPEKKTEQPKAMQDRAPETKEVKNPNTVNPNIGWLFSKGYYEKVEELLGDDNHGKEGKFKKKNDEIKSARLSNYKSQLQLLDQGFENAETFSLTTIYPGLFTGGGQTHETGLLGEFKLGFFFDHTTGLPILPGSSVKGLLRSAFKHPAYIAGLLESQEVKLPEVPEKIPPFIKQLEKEIFDGENQDHNNPPTSQTPYQRDIFFDAIIDPDLNKSDKQGKFLSDDYITPHNNQFTDPIPLQFLKVLPNITFKFRFRLNTGTVTAAQKLDLFRAILLDLGIGAKTNTGYGHFAQSK
jgi:CRISPR-associated protein Cmr6